MTLRRQRPPIRIGTAGWGIPAFQAASFPRQGTGLARYAQRFNAVEINTTFYRLHRPETFLKWAASVPEDFRFSVKLPRLFTHFRRLAPSTEMPGFLAGMALLGPRLGPLLVQLPPSLVFQAPLASRFLEDLRKEIPGPVALEPRHPSWFAPGAERLLDSFHVARVAADPAVAPTAGHPGGWGGLVYYRLHGSPRMYESDYEPEFLENLARVLRATPCPTWCIFDNTALGHGTGNALRLGTLAGLS
jgi:uncharacterized protein YecE (DUF72 family)